jgi:hypothetical protein
MTRQARDPDLHLKPCIYKVSDHWKAVSNYVSSQLLDRVVSWEAACGSRDIFSSIEL